MSNYRRYFVPGGTYFFTLVTHRRQPVFADESNVARLRVALKTVRREQPFEIIAADILPDHLHFIWSLPPGDSAYSKRIGRMKATFTKSLDLSVGSRRSQSQVKHRESGIWQRRFWEHMLPDDDFDPYFDYIHFNPVKHGIVSCPDLWAASSFTNWVKKGVYDRDRDRDWGCLCNGRLCQMNFRRIEDKAGEP